MTTLKGRGEHALVLRVGTFREIDCWVRFFSPLRGIETAFAFGGRRSRRRFAGCLDTLNHLRVDMDSPRSGRYLSLGQSTLVHRFPDLHNSQNRMGMAVNCIKFLEAAHLGADHAQPVFDLMLTTMQVLNDADHVPATFPLLFRAKLACFYGYGPDLTVCGLCGRSLSGVCTASFSWGGGYAVCPRCRAQSRFLNNSGMMDHIDVNRLHNLLQETPQEWLDSGRPLSGDNRLWQVLDFFVQYHTGLHWEAGRFRRM